MKNLTTKEFCRKFDACRAGTKFALKFATMRDCYAALLAGDAGASSTEWAIWAITRPGVMSARDLRLFAVRCARRVQHLMRDERSVAALDVAERYANGKATDDELAAASYAAMAARAAADAAWDDAAAAAWNAARAASDAAMAAWDDAAAAAWDASDAARDAADAVRAPTAWRAEREAQLAILAEFGNPFGEEEEENE